MQIIRANLANNYY